MSDKYNKIIMSIISMMKKRESKRVLKIEWNVVIEVLSISLMAEGGNVKILEWN